MNQSCAAARGLYCQAVVTFAALNMQWLNVARSGVRMTGHGIGCCGASWPIYLDEDGSVQQHENAVTGTDEGINANCHECFVHVFAVRIS